MALQGKISRGSESCAWGWLISWESSSGTGLHRSLRCQARKSWINREKTCINCTINNLCKINKLKLLGGPAGGLVHRSLRVSDRGDRVLHVQHKLVPRRFQFAFLFFALVGRILVLLSIVWVRVERSLHLRDARQAGQCQRFPGTALRQNPSTWLYRW